jgi:hypothetical protein
MPALHPRNVHLQERDVSLLLDLVESRVLSLDQICTLFFADKNEMGKKRVQRLKIAGLLVERPRRIGEPSILHLTWKGYLALRNENHIGEDSYHSPKTFKQRMAVSDFTLAHELMIGDVRTSFITALRDSRRFENFEFDVWPRRYDFTVNRGHGRKPVKPDGHIRFLERGDDERDPYNFFVEVDTGSEKLDRVVEKCLNYREYFKSGGFAVFCGGKREHFKKFPFQVLVVVPSEKRRKNLAELLLQTTPPFSTMILITTLKQCTHDPLGDIWMSPGVYKETSASGGLSIELSSLCE